MSKNKKYIIVSVIIVLCLIITICLAISANAENTGGTVEQREDEKTLVRMAASLSMGSASDNKVNIDTLEENLDMYVGSGVTILEETSSDVITVTFVATGNQYEINVNTGFEEEVNTTSLGTYLPSGFTEVSAATETTGLIIADSAGNEYVWVEVAQTIEVYPTAGLSITEFTDDEYTAIEDDLHDYTSVYRNGTSNSDIHSGDDASTGLTSTQYTELKQKMLKSVYQNGGFYVGRYETGIADSEPDVIDTTVEARISAGQATTQTPVIQANAYPYNFVTCSQAQSVASRMASGEYTSSLMFGVQWDLVLKYLETKGATQEELSGTTTGSTNWGNYSDNLWNITNTKAKYYYNSSWTDGAYGEKVSDSSVLLSTGADSSFSKMGIYDLAGNVYEWTLEYAPDSSGPCARRGGHYLDNGVDYPASKRNSSGTTDGNGNHGFRVSLY